MKKLLLAITSFLLITAPSFASGVISFKKLKTNVTKIEVRSRLIFSTRDLNLTPVQMKAINSSLGNFLNLTHDYKDPSGEKFQLSFNVTAVKDTEIKADLPSDNYIDVARESGDFASPDGLRLINYNKATNQADVVIKVGNKATISFSAIDPYSNTVSHETLHLLGLDDRYHNLILEDGKSLGVDDKSFDRDIMSSKGSDMSSLHIRSFVNLVKEAREQGLSKFYITEVSNYNVEHISEKPMYLMQVTEQP